MAASLTVLTSVKVSSRSILAANKAFQTLKSRFTSVPILQVPDPARQFVVEVEAFNVGVGAVLFQQTAANQKLYPCAFFSHNLSAAKRN